MGEVGLDGFDMESCGSSFAGAIVLVGLSLFGLSFLLYTHLRGDGGGVARGDSMFEFGESSNGFE